MINPKDIKSDTIEKVICIPFHQLVKSNKVKEMSSELSEILIILLSQKKTTLINIPEEEKPFLWKVMEKRMKAYHTFRITDERLYLFLCAVTERVGISVLYLWYLQYWCFINKVSELNLDILYLKIFPMGFPSFEDIEPIYDAQKIDGIGNLIDFPSAGDSIINIFKK